MSDVDVVNILYHSFKANWHLVFSCFCTNNKPTPHRSLIQSLSFFIYLKFSMVIFRTFYITFFLLFLNIFQFKIVSLYLEMFITDDSIWTTNSYNHSSCWGLGNLHRILEECQPDITISRRDSIATLRIIIKYCVSQQYLFIYVICVRIFL